jgi:hypothetical protein
MLAMSSDSARFGVPAFIAFGGEELREKILCFYAISF